MLLSTWRPAITAWLTDKIQIDTWELRIPEYVGETAAFLPPLRQIRQYSSEGGSGSRSKFATATQDIFITTRYSRDLSYSELPINVAEGAHASITSDLLSDYQAIAALIDVDTDRYLDTDFPVTVTEVGDDYGDWLISLQLQLTIKWLVEPEIGFGFPGYLIDTIKINLYRNLLDDSDKVLDSIYTTPEYLSDTFEEPLSDSSGLVLLDEDDEALTNISDEILVDGKDLLI